MFVRPEKGTILLPRFLTRISRIKSRPFQRMQHHRINYITGSIFFLRPKLTSKDVEGNCNYFDNYISICNDLSYEDEQKQTLKLKDGSYFVYGGDAPDRGWDISFTKKLINLKERYPDRVFLIIGFFSSIHFLYPFLGNRDINKILLSSELHDEDLKVPLDQVPGFFFLEFKKLML